MPVNALARLSLTNLSTVKVLLISAFVSLASSLTGVLIVNGFERVVSLSFLFANEDSAVPGVDDLGSAPNVEKYEPTGLFDESSWKLTSIWGDSVYYREGAVNGFQNVIAPYRYRLVPILIARLLLPIFGGNVQFTWVTLNLIAVAGTAVLISWIGIRAFQAKPFLAISIPALLMACPPMTHTVGLISVEPLSMFFMTVIALSFYLRSTLLFVVFATLGTLTKEVLAASAIAWMYLATKEYLKNRSKGRFITSLAASCIPFAAFIAVRIAFGASAFEVNYGFDLAQGELPESAQRFLSIRNTLDFMIMVGLSHTYFWFGALGLGSKSWLKTLSVTMLFSLIISIGLFSGRVIRPMGPIGPLLAIGVFVVAQGLDMAKSSKSKVR